MPATVDATQHHERPEGREHIPILPGWLIFLRIAQLALAVVILGLTAYTLSVIAFDGNSINMFTTIATMIATIYMLVAHYGSVAAYNYWAILGLDIFLVIFWLISFALLASEVPIFLPSERTCYLGYCYSVSGASRVYGSILGVIAGLGGLEFVLFVIALAFGSLAIHHHRRAGLHCMPGAARTEKPVAGVVHPQAAPQPVSAPQPVYQQQQTYQQPGQQVYQQPQPGYPQQVYSPQPQQAQGMYAPPQQQQPGQYPQQQQLGGQYPQQMHQPQPQYPQQTPSPLHAQHTGGYSEMSAHPSQVTASPVPQQQQQQQQQQPVAGQPAATQ